MRHPHIAMRKSVSRKNAGYTLIEIAAVIAVVGIVMATASGGWRVYAQQKAHDVTVKNVSDVSDALDEYLGQYGAYPCPAPLAAARDAAGYGMQGVCDSSGAPGTCAADGTCTEVSERADIANLKVKRGAVPFRALNLPEESSFDGFGMRLQYAVTQPLTAAATFDNDGGGISIINSDGASAFEPQGHAKFVVLSTGVDRRGAYSRDGKLVQPCDATAGKAEENCNTSPAADKAVYRAGRFAETADAGRFDDYIQYYSSVSMPLWKTVGDGKTIADTIKGHDAGRIGVGTTPPPQTLLLSGDKTYALDIKGNLRVAEKLKSDLICDNNGDNCFDPLKIAGDPDKSLICPADQCAVRIYGGFNPDGSPKNGAIDCLPKHLCGGASCPRGEFVRGVSPLGNLRCGPAPTSDCVPKVVPECGNAVRKTLPAAPNGTLYDFHWDQGDNGDPTPGTPDDYKGVSRWKCDTGRWIWLSTDWPPNGCAIQACEPEEQTSLTMSCINWLCGPYPRPPGFDSNTECRDNTMSGNVSYSWKRVCPSGENQYYDLDLSQCACTARAPETETRNCSEGWAMGAGYTGTQTRTRDWACRSGDIQGDWGPWSAWAPACQCTTRPPETDRQACGIGYSGEKTRTRNWSCPTATQGEWTAWTDWDMSACVCQPADITQNDACPAGSLPGGQITRQRHITCPSGQPAISDWEVTANTCVCDLNAPEATERRYVNCSSVVPGTVGNIVETRHLTACPATWSEWSGPTTNCIPGSYHWVAGGSPDSTVYASRPPVPMVDDACTAGQTGACARLTASGYIKYPSCVCANE